MQNPMVIAAPAVARNLAPLRIAGMLVGSVVIQAQANDRSGLGPTCPHALTPRRFHPIHVSVMTCCKPSLQATLIGAIAIFCCCGRNANEMKPQVTGFLLDLDVIGEHVSLSFGRLLSLVLP